MNYRIPSFPPQASELRLNESAATLDALRVSKRLSIGTRGTARWLGQFGKRLVCVRYREDPTTGRKFTTVELIVDERPPKAGTRLLLKIEYHESGLRQRAKDHGGQWDPKRKLWHLPCDAVESLGLQDRVVGKFPYVETKG